MIIELIYNRDRVEYVEKHIIIYCIAGNFRGTKYSWFSNIETFRG